ncbi:hypothetical protein B0T19DRAFT_13985 [Cercophora scortea]|uniref:RBR-type E3 ubiquitin transferase n=1 Tax=Cercophora scortea TaxID=314031 RepID=A0AAE0MLP4_9PEZI|nr:hypothetical protein B0T19DRAFT_13985 [Cercophora scortea]
MALECLICTASLKVSEVGSLLLPCGHVQCESCLQRNFNISVKTMPFQPVRCCARIEVTVFRRLVPTADLAVYREKLTEYMERSKLYCWDPACNAFIPNALRSRTASVVVGKCRRCHTKTCMRCRGKFHWGPCTVSPVNLAAMRAAASARARRRAQLEEEKFKEYSKARGWKECPQCRRMVEKTEGCNHIRCHCGCHFCYRCGREPYDTHRGCAM